MKNFFLSEILIYSAKERKAKRVKFHPRLTVILGKNDTGKSVLIKSIYHAFGANVKFDGRWESAATCALVRFTVDNAKYSILRWGKSFGLFDSSDKIIGAYQSITKELAPALAKLFDFGIVWNDRQNETVTLPPAYLLLPYYVDQDKSWSDNWNAFEFLGQYEKWRGAVIEYHTGLKPNEFYIAKTEFDKLKDITEDKLKEIKTMKGLLDNINKTIAIVDFTVDINVFKQEVEELIKLSSDLQKNQSQYKSSLSNLYSQKINLENQQKVVISVLGEIKKDLRYVTDQLDENVECPTCGAHYTNSFKERFAIAEDEHKCFELSQTLDSEIKKITEKINKEKEKLHSIENEIVKIQKTLSAKQGQIVLRDIIENEGKRQMKSIFESRIEEMNKEHYELIKQLSELDTKIKSFADKDRREAIISDYRKLMKKYLFELSVSLTEKDYEKIDCRIGGLGSAKPRGLLAYYYSILHVIKKYGSSAYCPIIIDEPDQQGQDDINMPNMLNFIYNNKPENTQLILGLQDTMEIEFEGSVIEIKDKFSILTEEDFEDVKDEISPLINMVLKNNNDLFGYN
jgi:hypothetical protein